MQKLLLVEDTNFFANLIKKRVEKELKIEVLVAQTLAEGKVLLEANREDIFLALLDLNLPDAADSDVVDYVSAQAIPSVVFTSSFSEDLREDILAKGVIDYVTKDTPASIDYVVSLVRRINNNQSLKALVVDDSAVARKIAASLLRKFKFEVLEASSGAEALKILDDNKTREGNDIILVLTDYNMPEMDGFELVRSIRKHWAKDIMSIIGISSQGGNALSAKFIKNGANDFIIKPFLPEEMLCRVSQNVDIIEQLNALQIAATRDYLTGMYNRRFFFEMATPLYSTSARTNSNLMVGMIDVDHFKSVNDTYGHDVGDEVLIAVANVLVETTRDTDIIARFGGEEFCLIAPTIEQADIMGYLNKIRAKIEALSFTAGDKTFSITASIGATCYHRDDLEGMINESDAMLYEAKESGRNRCILATP